MISQEKIATLKKDITFTERLAEHELTFNSTWGLFSPTKIDEGTRLLVEHMSVRTNDTCLDLGCGYGALAIFMARLATNGSVDCVDKDFVAIEYTKKNAALNALKNVSAYLSNGFSAVPADRKFSLIASNIPAKVGREQLLIWLADAHTHLVSGGRIYIVAISGLKDFVKNNLKSVFGNYKKLKQYQTYTAFSATRE